MAIVELLNTIETTFKQVLTGVKTIDQFEGPFRPESLKRISYTAPAVLFGFADAQTRPRLQDENVLDEYPAVISGRFQAICIGKHAKKIKNANHIALTLATQVAVAVEDNSFGLDSVGQGYDISIRPLAVGQGEKSHMAFVLVSWSHAIGLSVIDPQSLIETFGGYDADHYLPNADQANDAPVMQTSEDFA